MRFSEETRKKMSIAAKRRWAMMTSEEKEQLATIHSEFMKEMWERLTSEQRREQARKAALTRKRNRSDKRNL